jgi:FolB domain-containing protein
VSEKTKGPLTDRIIVRDFVLPMMIGIYEHEYLKPQRVRFNIDVDISRIDHIPSEIRDVFSYDYVTDGIVALAAEGHVLFVEQIAERVAAHVLKHARVQSVRVMVEKLDIRPGSVGIEIIRQRAATSA